MLHTSSDPSLSLLPALPPSLPPSLPLVQKKMAMRKELADTTYPKWFGLLSKKMVGREGARGGREGGRVPCDLRKRHVYRRCGCSPNGEVTSLPPSLPPSLLPFRRRRTAAAPTLWATPSPSRISRYACRPTWREGGRGEG